MKNNSLDQISLFDYFGFYTEGDYVEFSDLGSPVTFEWLTQHIGYQVALRYRTESLTYYVVGTVYKLAEGTYFKGCRRIILRTGKNSFPLLDEPAFFFQGTAFFHLVYEL